MIVVGGGYIGIEMGQILHSLGVDVTLVVPDRPLRHVDLEVVTELMTSIEKQGIKLVKGGRLKDTQKLSEQEI